jgi:CHAT domain-containing protein/tetratricopeptide (TPR) repeat protein
MSFHPGRLAALALLLWCAAPLAGSRYEDALDLEKKGKLQEAHELLRTVATELRQSGDAAGLARALSESSRVAASLGRYQEAIETANEAIAVRAKLSAGLISEDYNTLGLAKLGLGQYPDALANYQRALAIDRRNQDSEAQIIRLNNIGNVYYFRGQYQDAYAAYRQAMDVLDGAGKQPWASMRRQLTIANQAALYQRLGLEQEALELYRELAESSTSLTQLEYAQFLLNEGVLYRRLGDPVKALEKYDAAQSVFAQEENRGGEISALRNIGIARVMDLRDFAGARESFTAALALAERASDARGIVQACLYRGETERRMGLPAASKQDLETALAAAKKAGMAEEQWKSEYALGQIADAWSNAVDAEEWYHEAIGGIESMRAGIRRTNLRTDFLADKRDPYDALIALLLRLQDPPLEAIFSLMERSRARSFEDHALPAAPSEMGLAAAQAALPPDTALIEYWTAEDQGAALWATRGARGVVRLQLPALTASIEEFRRSLQASGTEWKSGSERLGQLLLSGIPAAAHLLISPDGALAEFPFEPLTNPRTGRLLVEEAAVTYLPAARFLTATDHRPRDIRPPWQTQMIAYGNPPLTGADILGAEKTWQPIPAAAQEIESIAKILPGASQIHLGAAASKLDLLSRSFRGVSLLHFSTHAVIDPENADRSRILLASESGQADSLYEQEVYRLNLAGVDLATISACETARGPMVRGDGVRAFTQAFLAAGAAATVTSLWPAADRATAEFMKQFYYFIAHGEAKAAALRSAKLQLLRSQSRLAEPRYWSGFILYGDGWDPCARFVPWGWLGVAAGGALLLGAILIRTRRGA